MFKTQIEHGMIRLPKEIGDSIDGRADISIIENVMTVLPEKKIKDIRGLLKLSTNKSAVELVREERKEGQ